MGEEIKFKMQESININSILSCIRSIFIQNKKLYFEVILVFYSINPVQLHKLHQANYLHLWYHYLTPKT